MDEPIEWVEVGSGTGWFMYGKLQHHKDPHLMDVHNVDGQWWLAQYSAKNSDVENDPRVRIGPFDDLGAAKAVAEMLFHTLVVKE